jgi:hypothetical protein
MSRTLSTPTTLCLPTTTRRMRPRLVAALAAIVAAPGAAHAQTAAVETPLAVDHYVRVVSKAPSMEGQLAHIYVRERVLPGTALARVASRTVSSSSSTARERRPRSRSTRPARAGWSSSPRPATTSSRWT